MRVLVTGNLGYIGSVLTPLLLKAGHRVRGLDTGYYDECLLGPGRDSPQEGFEQVRKDVRDARTEDLKGCDAVVHLAALSNDPMGEIDPALTEEINYKASVRLAKLAREAGVGRFLFSSSCSMYGQGEGRGLTEESAMRPLTAYARSKVQTEAAVKDLADKTFSPVFLRNATVYGLSPRLRVDLVVNNLVGWAVTTGEVKLLSDGRSWRPLVHVEDVARAFLVALTAPREAIHNEAFNVGANTGNYQIRDVADTVARTVPNCRVTFAEGAAADNRNYNVSFDKIGKVLPAFKPIWTVQKGVDEVYAGVKQAGLTFADFNGRRYTRLAQLKHLMAAGQIDHRLRWIGH